MAEEATYLGIDPGTNILGYGLIKMQGRQPQLKAMGVIDLRKCTDVHAKLGRIYERVSGLISSFAPTAMAIEAPFYGKNVQSMLKLGRAQGVAIAAAVTSGIEVFEYAPTKIKMALTGNGAASKEQVCEMLRHIFHLDTASLVPYMDATDALAAAYCHYLQGSQARHAKPYSGWHDFLEKNAGRIHSARDTRQIQPTNDN